MLQPELVIGVSLLYILLLFIIAAWADKRQASGRSVVANPHIYSLSIPNVNRQSIGMVNIHPCRTILV